MLLLLQSWSHPSAALQECGEFSELRVLRMSPAAETAFPWGDDSADAILTPATATPWSVPHTLLVSLIPLVLKQCPGQKAPPPCPPTRTLGSLLRDPNPI